MSKVSYSATSSISVYCFCGYYYLNRYASFLTLGTCGARTFFFNSLTGMPILRDSCFRRLTCLRSPLDVFLIFPLLVFVTIMSTPNFPVGILCEKFNLIHILSPFESCIHHIQAGLRLQHSLYRQIKAVKSAHLPVIRDATQLPGRNGKPRLLQLFVFYHSDAFPVPIPGRHIHRQTSQQQGWADTMLGDNNLCIIAQ